MSIDRAPLSLPFLTEVTAVAPPDAFRQALREAELTLPEGSLERLGQYVSLLAAASSLMNLTAIRQPDEIWMRLVLDALWLRPSVEGLPEGSRVLDVGCGAGLPGLPLAITCPSVRFALLDSTAKKVAFVRHAASELRLDNVSAVTGRAETLAAPRGARPESRGSQPGESAQPSTPLRESFDLVVARAVAPLPQLLELTAPFARPPRGGEPGGRLLLVKGQNAELELERARRAAQCLGVRHRETLGVPTGKLVCFDKHAPTPPQYPRGVGVPKRNPL